MKIREYPEAKTLEDNDDFVIETDSGTKHITKKTIEDSLSISGSGDFDVISAHRNTFRGKNLGSKYTEEQKNSVKLGTFDDLYIGDYWENGGIKYRIADIDYWYKHGVSSIDHHLIIFPDVPLYESKMFSSGTGGYASSLVKSNIKNAVSYFSAIFGSDSFFTEKTINETTKANSNYDYSSSVQSTGVIVPFESQITGFLPIYNNSSSCFLGQNDNSFDIFQQFTLFRLRPDFIRIDADAYSGSATRYWLQNAYVNNGRFVGVAPAGGRAVLTPTDSHGVRPYAIITG